MHKIFTLLGLCLCTLVMAQKKNNFNNIIKSQDIAEITEFLEVAHPDDPRRPVLKKRLIQLKNEAWTKGKENHKPMAARKIEVDSIQASVVVAKQIFPDETEEYSQLINLSSAEHKKKTVGVLNSLFDNDPTSKEATVMVENKSKCNIIVRMQGKNGKSYRLAVPAQKENMIVVEKNTYNLNSIVCGGQYSSQKTIQKPLLLTLVGE